MASVEVYLCRSGTRADTGATMPVPRSAPLGQQVMTSSTTATLTSVAVPTGISDAGSYMWVVRSSGGAVRVLGGSSSPTAVRTSGSEAGWLVPDGEWRDLGAMVPGEKLSVIDA